MAMVAAAEIRLATFPRRHAEGIAAAGLVPEHLLFHIPFSPAAEADF